MAKKSKVEATSGEKYLQKEHQHLLVKSVTDTVDEGDHVKILFTDENGAQGFVRLTKRKYDKYFDEDQQENK